MRKCDSCGKVVVNEQDYMCPHCGAVTRKHCDHQKHLPDDKYNRANDYRTTAAEHSSKTYDYEKAPRTDASQKFDINDLANIKNAEDAKRIAKKAFIEQDQNGRKKFKPLAIVLIVIFAVNIFGNLLGALGDGIDDVFEELEYAFEDVGNADYTFGEDEIIHDFYTTANVTGAVYDKAQDQLVINCSDIYFEYDGTRNEDYDMIADEWSSDFTFPGEYFYSADFSACINIFDENEVEDKDELYGVLDYELILKSEITEDGLIIVKGLASSIEHLYGSDIYIDIKIHVTDQNDETNEIFDYCISLPTNFIKINPDYSVEFYDIYADYDIVVKEKLELDDQYVPDEYIEHIELGDTHAYNDNIFESVPASVEYTETVTLVD